MLPYDFTNMNSDESMQTCRTLIYNEVLQFMKEREEEEEKISFVRRLSSSSKVYKQLITKQQPSSVLDEDKKKCAILSPVSCTHEWLRETMGQKSDGSGVCLKVE